jgi:hypothetical protein
MSKNNFVILIGGPGLYFACDPLHDKTWSNYIVPMQLAAEKKLYRLDSETVHWVIFAPAYRKRWNDDITISSSESKEYGVFGRDRYTREWEWYKSDTWLHDHRKQTAEKLKAKRGPKGMPATSYLVRISQICAQHNIVYHPIEKPKDFWAYLEGLENGSISRIWYCGHASSSSLLLDLDHGAPAAACEAISRNFLAVSSIRLNLPTIKPKIDTDTDKVSVFYGCNTAQFAREWNQQFEVATEGAGNKITFQAIYKGDPSKNVLERLKTKPTNSGSPNWQKFPKPKKNGH